MNEIKLKARAKINITLDVLGRRENGFHDVEMIMQTIDLFDDLVMRKTEDPIIQIKTNLPYLPTDRRNLVYQIIEYMREKYSIKQGVFVNLNKRIPVAAGLAGGSSNGAQTIIGMNQLFELGLTIEEMLTIGQQFGSDISYCIYQGTALATGLGEKITLIDPFPNCHVLLVKPKFGVSTATVYKSLKLDGITQHPRTKDVIEAIKREDLDFICKNLVNVLESVTLELHPEIIKIKEQMLQFGADGVLMSGSGPSVFALFKDEQQAEFAKTEIFKTAKMQYVYLTTIYNRKEA